MTLLTYINLKYQLCLDERVIEFVMKMSPVSSCTFTQPP